MVRVRVGFDDRLRRDIEANRLSEIFVLSSDGTHQCRLFLAGIVCVLAATALGVKERERKKGGRGGEREKRVKIDTTSRCVCVCACGRANRQYAG